MEISIDIQRIDCPFDPHPDWCVAHKGMKYERPILCDSRASEWWETDHLTKARLTISSEPTESSYLCKLEMSTLLVQDPQTERWHDYGIFSRMHAFIDDFALLQSDPLHSAYVFYLGLNEGWVEDES